jgi:hypothetical protein
LKLLRVAVIAAVCLSAGAAGAADNIEVYYGNWRTRRTVGGQEICSLDVGAVNNTRTPVNWLAINVIFGPYTIEYDERNLLPNSDTPATYKFYNEVCQAIRNNTPSVRAVKCNITGMSARACATLLKRR